MLSEAVALRIAATAGLCATLWACGEVASPLADPLLPIVVDFETPPGAYPSDPLSLGEASISGDALAAELSYGGGCRRHEIDLVAFNGWLESAPVQVDVLLSHDANGDTCEAYLTETRRFALWPLVQAYQEAYGAGEPGATTLILRLRDPDAPGDPRLLEYRF